MDETEQGAGAAQGAFEFHGNWREFAPIAFTNLLLTIVTLGIYGFWARTRERHYLWGQTRFIDDRLEWTGKGLELFVGYLLAFVLFLIPFGLLQFLVRALAIRGEDGLAALLLLASYAALLYLVGVAVFRGLRYKLSRTYWHGIRGGSNDQGIRYGLSHLWKTVVGTLALGLMVPWAMVTLWNERWNAMSFGPHAFRCEAKSGPLMLRYLLYYLVPIVMVIALVGAAAMFAPRAPGALSPGDTQLAVVLFVILFYLIFFVVLGLVALLYYAAYFREVVSQLSLGDLDFAFTARSKDWLILFVTNFLLVAGTLGIGAIFLGYRNWSFFIRHLSAYGSLDLDAFTQSTTRTPGQGEGLLDAFDVGAF